MILTGKAKQEFLKWVYSEYDFTEKSFNEIYPKNLKEYFIILWLDSVDIHLTITKTELGFHYNFNNRIFIRDNNFKSRLEATEKGIQTASAIYNENI